MASKKKKAPKKKAPSVKLQKMRARVQAMEESVRATKILLRNEVDAYRELRETIRMQEAFEDGRIGT